MRFSRYELSIRNKPYVRCHLWQTLLTTSCYAPCEMSSPSTSLSQRPGRCKPRCRLSGRQRRWSFGRLVVGSNETHAFASSVERYHGSRSTGLVNHSLAATEPSRVSVTTHAPQNGLSLRATTEQHRFSFGGGGRGTILCAEVTTVAARWGWRACFMLRNN